MRAAWLCTRDGTRRLTAEEPQDGQYREAASLEERAVDTAVSAVEAAVGATLRGGKKLAQQAARSLKYLLAPDFHDRALDPHSIPMDEELRNRKLVTEFGVESGFKWVYTLVQKDGVFFFSAPSVHTFQHGKPCGITIILHKNLL